MLTSFDRPPKGEGAQGEESENEKEPGFAELRATLKEIEARIEALSRTLGAANKSTTLTEQEETDRDAKGAQAAQNALESGANEDFARRIERVTKQQFVERLLHDRKQQIAESPQSREIDRLKIRKFDVEERMRQILSGE